MGFWTGLIFPKCHIMKTLKIFSETAHLISTKLYMKVPLANLCQNFDSSKNISYVLWAWFILFLWHIMKSLKNPLLRNYLIDFIQIVHESSLVELSQDSFRFITSNLSFSHSVFKRLVLQTRKIQGLFGKGLRCIINSLTLFQTSPVFYMSAPQVF